MEERPKANKWIFWSIFRANSANRSQKIPKTMTIFEFGLMD